MRLPDADETFYCRLEAIDFIIEVHSSTESVHICRSLPGSVLTYPFKIRLHLLSVEFQG